MLNLSFLGDFHSDLFEGLPHPAQFFTLVQVSYDVEFCKLGAGLLQCGFCWFFV